MAHRTQRKEQLGVRLNLNHSTHVYGRHWWGKAYKAIWLKGLETSQETRGKQAWRSCLPSCKAGNILQPPASDLQALCCIHPSAKLPREPLGNSEAGCLQMPRHFCPRLTVPKTAYHTAYIQASITLKPSCLVLNIIGCGPPCVKIPAWIITPGFPTLSSAFQRSSVEHFWLELKFLRVQTLVFPALVLGGASLVHTCALPKYPGMLLPLTP